MLGNIILILVSFLVPSYQFVSTHRRIGAQQHSTLHMTATAILPTKDSDTLTIRVANIDEIPRCAGFLSQNMYPADTPKGIQFLPYTTSFPAI